MDFILQVSDFYKRPQFDSPHKATLEDASHVGSRGVQLLGHIKNGSCRPRAILFKVLADTVGFESRLVVVSTKIHYVSIPDLCITLFIPLTNLVFSILVEVAILTRLIMNGSSWVVFYLKRKGLT